MNKSRRGFIKSQLRAYINNQKLLENPLRLLNTKRACQNALIVRCISDVLSSVPGEMQQYARLRYFEPEPDTLANIATNLNVSERTLNRWDSIIVKQIAEHIRKFNWKWPFA